MSETEPVRRAPVEFICTEGLNPMEGAGRSLIGDTCTPPTADGCDADDCMGRVRGALAARLLLSAQLWDMPAMTLKLEL